MGDAHEQTIVISDLLSFLACKIKLTTKEKLLKTLRRYYSEKDINEAHRTLLASLPEKKSTRHGRRVKNPDALIAMYDCFQLIPEPDLPIFVCKNLNNVPELETVIKQEPQDVDHEGEEDEVEGEEEEEEEIDEESEMEVEVEQTLREEQKTMKSQIADIAFVVKQLKDQLQNISQQNTFSPSEEMASEKSLRCESQTKYRSKHRKSEDSDSPFYKKPKMDSPIKKKGLAYLQSLIDEDEEKSDKDQSEKDNESDYQEDLEYSDTEYEDLNEQQGFESISCEVILKEEPEDNDTGFRAKNASKKNRDIFLVSPTSSGHKGHLRDEISPSKTVGQKVIYIKNEEDRDHMGDDENSIEIASASDYLGNLDDADPSSRISFELSSEEDFKGEIELMVVDCDPIGFRKENAGLQMCSICGEGFATQKKLDSHVKSHCIKKVFDCVLCDEGFMSKELLRAHFEQCLEATKKKYNLDAHPCPTCGRLYAQERALKQHSYMHSESRSFACNQCTYRYLTKNSLEAHIKTQHNAMNKYFCPFCDNSYISSGFLKNHIRSHTGERPFACKECGYKASTADLLKRHMLTHGPPKEYKCDVCDFTCVGIGKLSRHKAKEHKRENIFCTICGKEFNNSCVYHRHYMSHVGARPFPCTVCSYAAISKEVLMVHMRTHTGDNIINCPNCSVPFGTKYSLKRHLKSYCVNRSGYFNPEYVVQSSI